MSDFKSIHFTNPTSFILLGIPGLEAAHIWISIPFCEIYTIATLGIVRIETSLHAPMYYFLCMLAVVQLVLSTSNLPQMLSIFWLNSREIDFSISLLELYFIHNFTVMESGILVALALDHYVAICDPLGHSTILTNPVVVKIGLSVLLLGGLLILPHSFLAKKWPYYIPALFSFLTHRFGHKVPLSFQIITADIYLLVPFMLNPIIHGVRTKEIQNKLFQLFTH